LEVDVGQEVEGHVQENDEVFTDAEPGVNVGLAILVVTIVEIHEQGNEEDVDADNDPLQVDGGDFLAVLRFEPATPEQVVGGYHVTKGRGEEGAEADFVNVELFLGGDDAQAEQRQNLDHAQEKVEPDNQFGPRGQKSQPVVVNVVVEDSKKESRRGVDGDASLPNVFLRHKAPDGRRYRRSQVVHFTVRVC